MRRCVLSLLGYHCLCVVSVLQAQLVVAHRGASFDAPENTRASFQLAWKQEADAIETDLYLTSDQQIVCIHDPTTERVSGKNLPVAQSTLAELQALDVGSWKDQRFAGERMPGLPDVLALVPDDKCIYLEIKGGPEILPFLQQALTESRLLPHQTVIISFQRDVIRAAKQALPQRKAYWLVDFQKDEESGSWSPKAEELIAVAQSIHADGVDLEGKGEVVNETFVARCREAGLSVHVWTIDDPEAAVHFQRLGVASITTNRPGMLLEELHLLQAPPPALSRVQPNRRGPTDDQSGQTPSPAAVE